MDLVYPNEIKLFRIAMVLAAIFWVLIIFGTLGVALIYIGLFALFAIFAQSGFITHIKGNGIRITEEQYPDLHQRLKACCEAVGQEDIPEAYLLRTDFFNALATRFLRRHYIVLFTDVVDSLRDQPGAINFYIGHEIGHIQRNHIRWGWVLAPVLWLPVLGSAYRRAEEYTCDRYGNACCDSDEDAVAALSAIVAGDTRWKDIDVEAYLEQVQETDGFFMSLNEFVGEYPWLCKRMAWVLALRQDKTPELPRRSTWAGLLSVFVPSIPGGAVSFIILVAMIGIIAAVALPAYQSYIETAELARNSATDVVSESQDYWQYATADNLNSVLSETATVREQINQHYQQHHAFPGDLTDMGWSSSFIYSQEGNIPIAVYTDGVVAASIGSRDGADAYFVNEPYIDDTGEVRWFCYGQNMPGDVLPEGCSAE